MAVNRSAVARKLIGRGGGKAVQRARQVLAANPEGRLARRLGVSNAGPGGETIGQKGPINRAGKQVRPSISGQVFADMLPVTNAGQRFNKARMPGSPF